MATTYRPASFLPTIKCSSCSQEIEISMMGEHVCSTADAAADASSDVYSSNYSSLSSNTYDSKRYENSNDINENSNNNGYGFTRDQDRGRLPPQVDTTAANRSYHRPGQLTPVSNSSGSQSVSPKTPVASDASRAARNATGDYFEPTIAGDDSPGHYARSSPMATAKPGSSLPSLLQRMNTIAPGPFDVRRQPSSANKRNAFPTDRTDGPEKPDDFEPPTFHRAGTFPRLSNQQSPADLPSRTPSAPGTRPEHTRARSNVDAIGHDGVYKGAGARLVPDTSRPPRTSLLRDSISADSSSGSGSAVPQINLADEFGIGNPYHPSHDSLSSTVSSLRRPSIPFSSSQSSFSSAFSASSFSASSVSTASTVSTSSSTNSLDQAPRKDSNADVDSIRNDLQALSTSGRRPSAQMPSPQQSPMGSVFQDRRFDSSSNNNNNNNNTSYGRSSPERLPSRGREVDAGPGPLRTRTPAPAPPPTPTLAAPPSRGNCKACGDLITGKSVSSADGRLTGRYHKACFVCTTCTQPFTSATFYVHSDMPYCERHYHEVNGSLCGTCNNGIEGQYLADEADCKHHRTCFVCGDCGQPLEDGYFEVAGRVYCERDAWRRVQQPMQQPMQPPMNMQYQQPMQPQQYQQPMNMGRGYGRGLPVPRGLPSGPGSRRPSNTNIPRNMGMSPGMGMGMGMNSNMNSNMNMSPLAPPRQFGLPGGNRLGPRPRMEKRMTRLGMI